MDADQVMKMVQFQRRTKFDKRMFRKENDMIRYSVRNRFLPLSYETSIDSRMTKWKWDITKRIKIKKQTNNSFARN